MFDKTIKFGAIVVDSIIIRLQNIIIFQTEWMRHMNKIESNYQNKLCLYLLKLKKVLKRKGNLNLHILLCCK